MDRKEFMKTRYTLIEDGYGSVAIKIVYLRKLWLRRAWIEDEHRSPGFLWFDVDGTVREFSGAEYGGCWTTPRNAKLWYARLVAAQNG